MTEEKRSNNATLALGCIVVLLLCGFVFTLANLNKEPEEVIKEIIVVVTATPTTTSLATATPTQTPLPTETPLPTATLIPTNTATHTPVPTSTRMPTPTRTPQVDAKYIRDVLQQMEAIQGGLGGLSRLSLMVESIPSLLFDEDWLEAIAGNLVLIRMGYSNMQDMTVPTEMQGLHSQLLDALADCNEATYHYAEGLDTFDVKSIEKAVTLIESCGNKVENITLP